MSDVFASQTPAIDPAKDYLPDLVGEGKKYATPADLARAVLHKDLFINKLEDETKELRGELNTRMKMEEFVDKMSSLEKPALVTNQEQDRSQSVEPPQVATVKPEDVSKTVDAILAERERVGQEKRNLLDVQARLTEHFGDRASQVVDDKASKLGLGKEFLKNLAATQPKAFYAILGLDTPPRQAENPASGLRSQVNSDAFRPDVRGEKTQTYYDKLRQTDKAKYFSQEVQVEMHKQAVKLGADFFDK